MVMYWYHSHTVLVVSCRLLVVGCCGCGLDWFCLLCFVFCVCGVFLLVVCCVLCDSCWIYIWIRLEISFRSGSQVSWIMQLQVSYVVFTYYSIATVLFTGYCAVSLASFLIVG